MRARLLIEIAHLVIAVALTMTVFLGAAWGYPQGRDTIITVGWITTVIVAMLQMPGVMRAAGR